MTWDDLNIWAILAAAAVKFFIGGLWYSPILFGAKWVEAAGLKMEELGSPTKPMLMAAGLGLITALTLAVIIGLGHLGPEQAMAIGSLAALGLVATQLGTHFAFEGRPFRLWAIYAGQYFVEFIVMAAIIGYWR